MECGQNPQSIWQALASALVKDGDGKVYLNLALLQSDCSAITPLIDCNNNHIDPGSLLTQAVGVDDCSLPVVNALIPLINLNDLADVNATSAGPIPGQMTPGQRIRAAIYRYSSRLIFMCPLTLQVRRLTLQNKKS